MTQTRVDNELYRWLGHAWWDENVGEFSSIRFFVNPVRFAYFMRVLRRVDPRTPADVTLLDVGCGGGLLTEEFARTGLRVAGVDPAPESIETARHHAVASSLAIDYAVGSGEELPFPDASFDHVACCDVLEHVEDVDRVIHEIARVLRPGGVFLYDTINRTFISKLAVIKVMQEWPSTAFAEPNLHIWDRFIKPEELKCLLTHNGLEPLEMRGISIRCNPVATWLNLRRRAKGQLTFKELGQRLAFHESGDLSVSYMGHAARISDPEWK